MRHLPQAMRRALAALLSAHPLVAHAPVAAGDLAFNTANLRVLCAGVAIAVLAFWPTDLLVYAPQMAGRMALWRLGCLAWAALAYFGLGTRLGTHLQAPFIALVAGGALLHSGYFLITASDPMAIYYTGGAVASWLSVAWFGPLPGRALFTAACLAGWVAGCELGSPGLVGAQSPLLQLFMFATSASFALTVGHVVYALAGGALRQRVALDRQTRELQELDRLKNELFANVTHELRTPLSVILGNLRSLRRDSRSEAQRASADAALRNTGRLLKLIEDLLALARFEGGAPAGRARDADLAAMARDVVAAFAPAEPGASPQIRLEADETSCAVHADPGQLRTLLFNLLSNAVKFTDPATREVVVRVDAGDDEIRLVVSDNGIGIPPERLEDIFERFVQVDAGATRRYEGCGIGLALVRAIARQHGGEVRAESQLGRGTRMHVRLPRRPPATVPIPEPAPGLARAEWEGEAVQDLRRRFATPRERPADASPRAAPASAAHILVVDDNDELRAWLRALLSERYQVSEAVDGADGLQQTRRLRPDLVLSDVLMPHRSGPDLLHALRDDESLRDIPVVFLTARAGADARAEALSAGADDYLSRPFDERELLARIENLLARRRQQAEIAALNANLERRVTERTEELRALAAHLNRALEDERRRISRDLHDDLGVTLTLVRMEVVSLLAERALDPERTRAALSRQKEQLDGAFASWRRILAQLRPQLLDDLGLVAAAEWLVEDFRAHQGIGCELVVEPAELEVDGPRAEAIFRILQECLTNVARHARATRCEVHLTRRAGVVEVLVTDDGVGLEDAPQRPQSFGLLNMRERCRQFGGRFEAARGPAGGTRVAITLPAEGSATS